MNENENKPDEITRIVEDETSDMIEEIVEEVENEAYDIVEDTIEEVEKENADEEPEDVVEGFALPQKAKKQTKARLLVEQTKSIVNKVNKRIGTCKHLIESDLKMYEDAKSELRSGGLDACESLVKKLGSQIKDVEPSEEILADFDVLEKVKPLEIKDVSSCKITGLMYALIAGLIAAVGLVYLATEKLEITLSVTKVPSEDIVQSILAWFSTIIGMHEDVYIGAGVFGFVVLLVMTLVYIGGVSLKASSNLHFAVKQFVEAQVYEEQNRNCEDGVSDIDTHIKKAIDTLKTYQVLLNEQQGKLLRILHIEGEKEKSTQYHDKSYIEIGDTKELIETINEFIHRPMSYKGKLSAKNVLFLQHAKEKVDKVMKRFY